MRTADSDAPGFRQRDDREGVLSAPEAMKSIRSVDISAIMPSSYAYRSASFEDAFMHHIPLDAQDDAVKRFFPSLPVDPLGSVVELNGQAVACVVPMSSANGDAIPEWTDEKNNRRCDLIDKKYAGSLTPAEAIELRSLQEQMLRYRESVAPLPLAEVRRLHQELLAKAHQHRP